MSNQERVLRPAEAARFLGIARATIYHWAATRPDFPRRIKIGPRTAGWRLSDLEGWLEKQCEESQV